MAYSDLEADASTAELKDLTMDVERGAVVEDHLTNTTVRHISWSGVTVTVKDRETKRPKTLVDNVEGLVEAGEICALMGPSGCGKTTLLNVLAQRPTGAASVEGVVLVNGTKPTKTVFRDMTNFVEQEDALIGALTVRETLAFSSRLSTSSLSKKERLARIDGLLNSFGLREQADTLIGTPIRKGISGGQKRRVGVASQLITCPKILFLDEPTSGLDSAASWEVVKYLKAVAKRNNLIVIASIHQPSSSAFNLFDKLLLLSGGRAHYFGPVGRLGDHYASVGRPIPLHVNPAEHLLEAVNADFAPDRGAARQALDEMQRAWAASPMARELSSAVVGAKASAAGPIDAASSGEKERKKPGVPSLMLTLLHRSFIKSYRDVVAYGVRLAMYMGLAIMMGTVWLRLSTDQSSIIPFINAIFYGSAFMSFMAVAYVPAFLEDRHQFVKEHRNGLYGALELVASNFLVGGPFLFLFALLFSAVAYWLSNFRPGAPAFFVWVLWLFLDLLAAESLVVLVTSLLPSFVGALAVVAFANGLWMSVDGFMVPPRALNAFYRYAFHPWDYQTYVFQNMMVNEFAGREYRCGEGCRCMYRTELEPQCRIAGQGVLDQYGYRPGHMGRDVGIMIGIIAGYRVAAWAALKLRA